MVDLNSAKKYEKRKLKDRVGRTPLTAILIRAEAANFQHIKAPLEPQTRISKEINFLPNSQKRKLQADAWLQVSQRLSLTSSRDGQWIVAKNGTPEKELPYRILAR